MLLFSSCSRLSNSLRSCLVFVFVFVLGVLSGVGVCVV